MDKVIRLLIACGICVGVAVAIYVVLKLAGII